MEVDDDPNRWVSIPMASLIALLGSRARPAAPPIDMPAVRPVDMTPAPPEQTASIETVKVQILPDGRMDCNNAALYMGNKEKTLATWRTQGKGPRFVKVGGRVFYYRDDLDAEIGKSRRGQ